MTELTIEAAQSPPVAFNDIPIFPRGLSLCDSLDHATSADGLKSTAHSRTEAVSLFIQTDGVNDAR